MRVRRSVVWIGPRPGAALLQRLAAGNFVLTGRGPAAIAVVSTARATALPAPPSGAGAFLWWCAGEVPPAAAAEAIRRGAYDVIAAAQEEAGAVLLARLAEMFVAEAGPPATPGLIAESGAARAVLDQAWRAARTRMPVFLTGETGTGKEVLAGLIHRWSARTGAYVPINCAAIPNELMESELFGHIRGAFSGAVATVDGKLLAAQGGTVFLDEIDDTPLNIQNKLLRVLEDGQVTRVGESQARPADFRLITASNRDLQPLIAVGRFGLDFFERLAIVRIELPPLAARREDIAAFVQHFIARFYATQGTPPAVDRVSPRALAALTGYA